MEGGGGTRRKETGRAIEQATHLRFELKRHVNRGTALEAGGALPHPRNRALQIGRRASAGALLRSSRLRPLTFTTTRAGISLKRRRLIS